MTYLDLVNSILVRLRQSTVSTVEETPYSALIGKLVNDAKREVEGRHKWECLRTVIPIQTAAGIDSYEMIGATRRTRIFKCRNEDLYTDLYKSDYESMRRLKSIGQMQQGAPFYYAVTFDAQLDKSQVEIWPVPDKQYSLFFICHNPQDDLVTDGDIPLVRSDLIEYKAYSKALSERGEDGGQRYDESVDDYNAALGQAVCDDLMHQPHETDWRVV